MTAREPSLPEILDAALTARLRSVHTALPGTIRSYSEADQTCTVELAVQLETNAERFAKVPNLSDVPVVWPGAWSNGDKCLVIFSEEDPSKWWDSGSVEPPPVMARHGLHATAVPIVATAGQTVQFVALANLVDTKLNLLRDAIASASTTETNASGLGGMAALGIALAIPPSPAPATPLSWPLGSTAATKVKAR